MNLRILTTGLKPNIKIMDSTNSQPKQPQKPTEENKQFQEKLARLEKVKVSSLQEFIKLLDALD